MPPIFTQQQPTDTAPVPTPGVPTVDTDAPATLPDVIVDSVPTPTGDGFWETLTQPQATLGAGVLAIIAATIAFAGVYLTLRSGRATTKATLRVQSMAGVRQQRQHDAQLAATARLESAKHRRQVEYNALNASMMTMLQMRNVVMEYRMLVNEIHHSSRPHDAQKALDKLYSKAVDAVESASAAAAGLLLIGAKRAYREVTDLTGYSNIALMETREFNSDGYSKAVSDAANAIRDAYKP